MMKSLIVEDDFISRRILKEVLGKEFDCDIAVNGEEAVLAFTMAHEAKRPYEFILLDIMMPVMDGNEALVKIREKEKELGIPSEFEVKIIMTSALGDPKTVMTSLYKGGATSYIVKPVSRQKLLAELRSFGIIG